MTTILRDLMLLPHWQLITESVKHAPICGCRVAIAGAVLDPLRYPGICSQRQSWCRALAGGISTRFRSLARPAACLFPGEISIARITD